jgi:hypothetical protein
VIGAVLLLVCAVLEVLHMLAACVCAAAFKATTSDAGRWLTSNSS